MERSLDLARDDERGTDGPKQPLLGMTRRSARDRQDKNKNRHGPLCGSRRLYWALDVGRWCYLYHLPIILHLLPEDGAEDYLEVLGERIMIQIVEVYPHFIGIDHSVVVFYGDVLSRARIT